MSLARSSLPLIIITQSIRRAQSFVLQENESNMRIEFKNKFSDHRPKLGQTKRSLGPITHSFRSTREFRAENILRLFTRN